MKCQCLYCSAAVVYHRQKAEGEGERWKEGEREQERERWLSFSLQIVSYSTVNDARHYSPLFASMCLFHRLSRRFSSASVCVCVYVCVFHSYGGGFSLQEEFTPSQVRCLPSSISQAGCIMKVNQCDRLADALMLQSSGVVVFVITRECLYFAFLVDCLAQLGA